MDKKKMVSSIKAEEGKKKIAEITTYPFLFALVQFKQKSILLETLLLKFLKNK